MGESNNLIFVGIDDYNRPVFKQEGTIYYYGATDKLFNYNATPEEVLSEVTENDLCYFGNSFGCEPMGGSIPARLKIKKA
jgi:hypothetical protein